MTKVFRYNVHFERMETSHLSSLFTVPSFLEFSHLLHLMEISNLEIQLSAISNRF